MPPSKHHTSLGSVSGLTESMAAQQFAVVSEMPYVVVVSVNRRGRITFFSRGAERITGYTHDELARKSFVAHLIPPEQHQLVRGHIQEVVTGTSVEFVSQLITKTGKMQTIKWTGSPRTDAEGTVRGVLIVGVDVTELADLDSLLTEQKRTEQALRDAEARWRSLVEHAPDLILLVNRRGTIQFINRVISNRPLTQVIGEPVYKFVDAEYQEVIMKTIERVFETGEPGSFEVVGVDSDGAEAWYHTRVGPVIQQGQVIAAILLARDDTARLQAERALQESEKKYRVLVEHALHGVVIIRGEPGRAQVVFANPAMSRISGYTLEELMQFSSDELLATVNLEDRQLFAQVFWQQTGDQQGPSKGELRATHKDGRTVWVEVTASPIEWLGEPAFLIGFVDISERKRAEQELLESQEFTSTILDYTPNPILVVNADTSIRYVNSAFTEVTEFAADEVVGLKPPFPYWIMDTDQDIADAFSAAMDVGYKGREVQIRTKSDEYRWVRISSTPVISSGELKYYISTWTDITEGKAAEQALRESEAALHESEAKYRALVEGAPVGILIRQGDSLVFANEAAASIHGRSVEELLSLPFDELLETVHPEDREIAIQRHADRMAGKPVPTRYESRIVRKDGSVRWLEAFASRIEYKGTPATQFMSIDITERKQTEAALRDSEARYRSLFDSVPIGLYRSTPEGLILDGNPAMVEMLGYPDRDTLLTINASDLYVNKAVRDQWQRELEEKGVLRDFEMQLSRFDGQQIWVFDNSRVIRDSDGTILYYEGALQDVTQRKEVAEAYRQIVESAPVELVILQDQRIAFANQLFCDITGFSQEELYSMTTEGLYIIVFKEDLELVLRRARERMEGAVPPPPLQFRSRCKDGTLRWVEGTSRRIEYQGRPALQVALIDITERKEAEKSLIESEEKYRTLFETMAQGVVYQNRQGEITSANPAAERILGLSLDQMQGRTSVDSRWRSIHEDGSDFPGETHPAMVALKTGEEVHDVIMGVYNPTEDITRWININAVPQFRNGEAQPYQVYTTFDDITEQKRAQEALQESERKYRSFIENFPGIAYRAHLEGTPLFFQGAVEPITGYTEDDFVSGRITWMQVIHPEDWSQIQTGWEELGTVPGAATEREYRIIHREGHIRWMHERIRNLIDETGKVILVEGVLLDITERKLIDTALQRERDRAQQYLDVVGVILVALDKEERVILINRKGCELLGVSEEEALGRNWFDTFLPERFRLEVKQVYTQLMSGEAVPVEYFENPILTHQGEERLIAWRNVILRDEEGKILGSLSSGEDITERRQMEQALLDSEERLRAVTEHSPDQIILLDQKFRILFINRILENYTMGEVLGKSVLDFISPAFRQTASNCYQRVWVTGKPQTFYSENPQGDGTVQVFEVRVSPILESGQVVALVSNSTDITARRATEEQLRESEAKYRSFVENFLGIAYRSGPDYSIEFFHGAVESITGYSEEDFVSGRLHWNQVIHPKDWTRLQKDFDRMGEVPGAIGELEYRIIRKDGSIRWLHDNMRGLYSEDYKVTAIEGVLIDITERKEAEGLAFEARARAEFFNDLMVHDLTNIHQAIMSLLELVLLDSAIPSQAREFVQTALAQLARSSDLISKVKKFSLIDTAPVTLEQRDISEPLFAAADAIRDSYPQRKLHIKTLIAAGRYLAKADEFLYDLFFNLLHNAMRYDRRNEVHIDILAELEGEFLKIKIQDRGPGIADADKETIFTRLSSRERGKRGVRGRGIGLTLVQRIATRYSGKIWVEDRVPGDHSQGASFVILLQRGDTQ